MEWGKSTNQGTARVKLAHQFQKHVLLKDDFIAWFFDDATVAALRDRPLDMDGPPASGDEQFQRVAYWYTILRELYGDDAITRAVSSGIFQVLLLGSGYDTRFFRLPVLQHSNVQVCEVDLHTVVANKQRCIAAKLERLPLRLSLLGLDFNHDPLSAIFEHGIDPSCPVVCIWQGVSYYLPRKSVSAVLDFARLRIAPGSTLVFDACTPLMLADNECVPGIRWNIERLREMGEPYQFGLDSHEMEAWLQAKGFHQIQMIQLPDLEEKYLHRRTLPDNMWYLIDVRI